MTIWCKLVNWNQSHRATIFTRWNGITKFHAWAFSQQDYSVFWFIYHGLKKLLHEPMIDIKTFRPANCHSFGQPGSQRSIKISHKIQAFGKLSWTLHKAVPQPGRLFQHPYVASIGVTPRASGASYTWHIWLALHWNRLAKVWHPVSTSVLPMNLPYKKSWSLGWQAVALISMPRWILFVGANNESK